MTNTYDIPVWTMREIKKQARELVFHGQPRKGILTLPGSECEDVALAIQRGILTPDSILHLVERCPRYQIMICDWVKRHKTPCPFHLYPSNLCQVEFPIPTEIDLAYIDLLGNPTQDDAVWLHSELGRVMTTNSEFAMTCAFSTRNNFFPLFVEEMLWKNHRDYFREACRNLIDFPKDFRARFTTLYLLLRDYVFVDRDIATVDFHWYKEKESPWTMFLVLARLGHKQSHHELTTEQRFLRRLIEFGDAGENIKNWRPPSPKMTGKSIMLDHDRPLTPAEKAAITRQNNILARKQAQSQRETAASSRSAKAAETRKSRASVAPVATASQVIDALIDGSNNATRLLNTYVKDRVAQGYGEKQVRAAIKAHVTRRTS